MMETSATGGEGTNSFRNNRNVEYKKGAKNSRKGPTLDEVNDSTIMKDARNDILGIGEMEAPQKVIVHAYTLHIS